ncbi:MAG: zinc ribbon domain-containing protein [Deltaproteobacteria bacterium]|nr:zinc ribbon domain-containing protein [Deltaproteobacteria bacterium]
MPLYEYRCGECSKVFEAYVRSSERTGETPCPACGGTAGKLGISLFSTKGSREGAKSGGSSCGSGSRRSPFS